MYSGEVSRGKLRGRFADRDRLAEHRGAPTIVEAYGPTKADPFYDRIYREPGEGGRVIEVWCRAQPLTDVKDLVLEKIPLATALLTAPEPMPRPGEVDREPSVQLVLL